MVEQNARQALAIADRGYVLVDGRNRLDGTGPGLLADPDVGAMFLGGSTGPAQGGESGPPTGDAPASPAPATPAQAQAQAQALDSGARRT